MIGRELVAATSSPFVLAILRGADSYGYEIIQRVAASTNGELTWSEAMLYPVLHRLEERRFIRSYWRDAPSGRKRKYYAITATGKAALAEMQHQWIVVASALRTLMN